MTCKPGEIRDSLPLFNRLYTELLSLLIVFFAPWFAIYVTDWLLRRGQYDPASLVNDGKDGRYWRKGGIHVPGVVATIAGMAATLMWLDDAPAYVGPLSSRTHGSDFSIFMGIGVAAAVYWVRCYLTRLAAAGGGEPRRRRKSWSTANLLGGSR